MSTAKPLPQKIDPAVKREALTWVQAMQQMVQEEYRKPVTYDTGDSPMEVTAHQNPETPPKIHLDADDFLRSAGHVVAEEQQIPSMHYGHSSVWAGQRGGDTYTRIRLPRSRMGSFLERVETVMEHVPEQQGQISR